MKKLLLILFCLCAVVLAASLFLYSKREWVVERMLSKNFDVPVSLSRLDISKRGADLERLWMGNPRGSRTNTSFLVERVKIDTTLQDLRQDPRVIEKIAMKDVFIGIEYYGNKKETNWSRMLKKKSGSQKGKKYWIRSLELEGLTVEMTQANGSMKRYHLKDKIVFQEIRSDEGLPLEEIEKAIFYQILKDVLKRLNLEDLFQNTPVPNPFKLLFSSTEESEKKVS